jgi:hypothetical protein
VPRVPQPAKVELVRRGLKQNHTAAAIGIGDSLLGDVLNRRRASWPALRAKLSEYLGIPEGELFDDFGDSE